jgi:hypothetical protein
VIQALRTTLSPISIVEAIARKDSESLQMFYCRYERGLRYLIRRYRVNNPDECLTAVVNASIEAVLNGEASSDDDLPGLILLNLRRTLLNWSTPTPYGETFDETPSETANETSDLAQMLRKFKPSQREALFRFYIKEEGESTICGDLGLTLGQFRFIRKSAKGSARLSMPISSMPTEGEPVSRLKKWFQQLRFEPGPF